MGLFGMGRKPWQEEDPKKRLAGLNHIGQDQQALLTEIARDDRDPSVRHAAASRLREVDLLRQLLTHTDEQVVGIVRQRLAGSLVDAIKRRPMDQAKVLLDEVSEQSSMAEIALHAQDTTVRREACRRLCAESEPSPALLSRVVIQDESGDFAETCLRLIDKLSALKEIAKKAKHDRARQAAQERYEQRRAEIDKPSPEKQRKARRRALKPLIEQAQKAAASSQWEASEQSLNAMREQWQVVLADYPELPLEEAATELQQRFERSFETFTRRREEAAAKRAEQEQAGKDREAYLSELCEELEHTADLEAGIAAAHERWAAFGEALPEQRDELEQRFQAIMATPRAEDEDDAALQRFEEPPVERGPSEDEEKQITEVLAEADRLATSDDWKAADQAFKSLHKRWNLLMASLDRSDPRRQAFNDAYQRFKERRYEHQQQQQGRIEDRLATLDQLVSKAQQLVEQGIAETDASAGNEQLKQLKQDWQDVGPVPRPQLQPILDRFHDAVEGVYVQLRKAYQAQDWERFHNATLAEEIIDSISALIPEDEDEQLEEPEQVLEQVKALQERWRKLGYLPRERKDELWQRYKAIGDQIYSRLQPFFQERDQEREQNLLTKQDLLRELKDIVEIEQPHGVAAGLMGADDPKAGKSRGARVKAIQESWKQVGPVPREQYRQLSEDYRRELDRFYQGRRIQYQHVQEEQEANLEHKRELLADIERLVERAEHRAEGKLAGVREEHILHETKELQRAWRQAGHVPRANIDEINGGFKAACDRIYGTLQDWFAKQDEERQGNLQAKLELIKQLEELCEEERPDWFRDEVDGIRKRWNEIGYVPRDQVHEINDRFHGLLRRILGEEAESA